MRNPDRCSMVSYDWSSGGSVGAFLGMVWFQVYEGSQCYSKEWVWNSRIELCWKVVGTGIYVGYTMF